MDFFGQPYKNGMPIIPWENKPLKNKRLKAKLTTNQTFFYYYNFLTNLATNLFTYYGLPETVDQRFLELGLCNKGFMVYFRDEVMGDLCLNCTISSRWNVYNIPMGRRAYATNGYQNQLDETNSVLIFNNYTHTPTLPAIELYAERLTRIERSIDVNVNAQKTPFLILCDEDQLLSMKNTYKDMDDFMPVIYGNSNSFKNNEITSIQTIAPYISDKLGELKRQTINDFLSFIGVENTGSEKRERQNTIESGAGLGYVNASRNVLLNSRREAIEKINKMFGRNIEVEFNRDFDSISGYIEQQNAITAAEAEATMSKELSEEEVTQE